MPHEPTSVSAIRLPLRHIGSVNAWLLHGDPLTLIDVGPCSDEAMEALDAGLRDAGVRIELDRAFSQRLMSAHGVPDAVIEDNEEFWDFIRSNSADFDADVRLADGDTIHAGGRDLLVDRKSTRLNSSHVKR